jgi:hypothetical protein
MIPSVSCLPKPWALRLRSASPTSHSSSLPTVQRGQVLYDRGWQSTDCAGTVIARIVWNCNRDIGAPQTEQVNERNRLIAKKIEGAWRVSDRCL